MGAKKHAAVEATGPTKGKKVRRNVPVTSNDTPEAPKWELTPNELGEFIPDEVRDYIGGAKDDFYNRMQVAFCCLFYRCHYYSEKMVQALIDELHPQVFRLSEDDIKIIGKRFQILLAEIATVHMQLTNHFVKHTARGKAHTKEAATCRASKIKLPNLNPEEILEALQLTPGALRLLWMPIVPVVAREWVVSKSINGSDLGVYSAYFRTLTGILIGGMARLFSERQQQISSSAQIALFSDNSHPKADREWPTWNLETSELKHYVNGIFLRERDRKKIEMYLSRLSIIVDAKGSEDDNAGDEVDGEVNGGGGTSAVTTTILGEGEKEVTGRPIEFGSEFRETGGTGVSKEVMDEVLSVDAPHTNRLTSALRDTAQRLENAEIEIAEIAVLAKVGVRGLTKYTMERILAEGRIICEAIYACDTALKQNKAQLSELYQALAEQEKKAEWFRAQQNKLRLSNAEVEDKRRELDLSIKNTGADRGADISWFDRASSKPRDDNWMDQLLPTGLQPVPNVGWAGNPSASYSPGGGAPTSSQLTPSANRRARVRESPVVSGQQFGGSPPGTGIGAAGGEAASGASNLFSQHADAALPLSFSEIIAGPGPMREKVVADPTEAVLDEYDDSFYASK